MAPEQLHLLTEDAFEPISFLPATISLSIVDLLYWFTNIFLPAV